MDARAKLAARFGQTQIGGKGSQRRTKKVVHHQEVNEDKKLKSTIKKFGKFQARFSREFLLFLHVMLILISGIFRYATIARYR